MSPTRQMLGSGWNPGMMGVAAARGSWLCLNQRRDAVHQSGDVAADPVLQPPAELQGCLDHLGGAVKAPVHEFLP